MSAKAPNSLFPYIRRALGALLVTAGDAAAIFVREPLGELRLYKQTVTKQADPSITRKGPATLERPGPRHDGGDRHAGQE